MFQKWLNEHTFSDYTFTRLFPKASDRAFWDSCLGQHLIADAERYLGYEWPLIRASHYIEFRKSGDRKAQENPHIDRRSALLSLFLGELAEHKGRFLPDLVDGIFAICEETYWGLSAHQGPLPKKEPIRSPDEPYIDIYAAETAELLVVIYHVLYEELQSYGPPILRRIEYELDRRIVTPYLTHIDYNWMGYTGKAVNNWLPWILSNVLTVFLLADLRRSQLEIGLFKMFTEMQKYYDTIPADGGCNEGSGYWTKSSAKVFVFCDLLYCTTGGAIDFFGDPKLKQMGLYGVRTYIDSCNFVNFSDGTSSMKSSSLDYPISAFGKRLGEASLCHLAGALKRNRNKKTDPREFPRGYTGKDALYAFIYAKEIDAQPPIEPQKTQVLPDLQNAFLRRGLWYLAAKGGHNQERHNHNDVGSFILYHEGVPLLIDPGCGTYTRKTFGSDRYSIWTMQSGWHNLPVLNGKEQPFGAAYAADAFEAKEDSVTVSFAGAYPKEVGVVGARRCLTLTEEGLTVSDTFDFLEESNTIEEHFITLFEPQKTENGILLDGRFLLQTDLPWEAEYCSYAGDKKLIDAWNADGVWRICVKTSCGKNKTIAFKVGIK